MMHVGDIMSTVGVFSTVGDIIKHVGDILSTVGCSVPWGSQITKDFSPHGTEHPPWYSWYPPTCIMISPTVLNIPHGAQNNPSQYS